MPLIYRCGIMKVGRITMNNTLYEKLEQLLESKQIHMILQVWNVILRKCRALKYLRKNVEKRKLIWKHRRGKKMYAVICGRKDRRYDKTYE